MAQNTRLLCLDVDGILTDAGIYVAPDGTEMKRFSIVDGAGIVLLLRMGVKVAILSGHASAASRHRFEKLGIPPDDIILGHVIKGPPFFSLLERHGLTPEQTAVMGDDLFDLPLFQTRAFKATVPEAHPEIRRRADYVTAKTGGRGAVREVAEMILKARGLYDAMIAGIMG